MVYNGLRLFSLIKSIPLKEWMAGYQCAKKNVSVESTSSGAVRYYYCPTGESVNLTKEEIDNVTNMNWNTFDRFKKRALNVWIIEMSTDVNWAESSCSCLHYFKAYICKHIIGLAIRLKLVKPPPASKNVEIGQKRKRGRPKLTSRALLTD